MASSSDFSIIGRVFLYGFSDATVRSMFRVFKVDNNHLCGANGSILFALRIEKYGTSFCIHVNLVICLLIHGNNEQISYLMIEQKLF